MIRRLVQRVLSAFGLVPRREYTPEEARELLRAHMQEHADFWKESDQ